MVHLDARATGVCVPQAHGQNPAMALNLSYRFQISDFRVDDEGVFASLSFDSVPFACDIPWKALYAMRSHVDDTMHVWAEDIPPEIMEQAQIMGGEGSAPASIEAASAAMDSARSDNEAPSEDHVHGRATSVPYLRVIK
jgi:hypothetical protein